jgi:hypothetical protein
VTMENMITAEMEQFRTKERTKVLPVIITGKLNN